MDVFFACKNPKETKEGGRKRDGKNLCVGGDDFFLAKIGLENALNTITSCVSHARCSWAATKSTPLTVCANKLHYY
jgi:hypothetical protein